MKYAKAEKLGGLEPFYFKDRLQYLGSLILEHHKGSRLCRVTSVISIDSMLDAGLPAKSLLHAPYLFSHFISSIARGGKMVCTAGATT